MAYGTPEFWAEYAAFVEGALSRHRMAIDHLLDPLEERGAGLYDGTILDLGCGRVHEGAQFFCGDDTVEGFDFPLTYIGVDKEVQEPDFTYIQTDYRNLVSLKAQVYDVVTDHRLKWHRKLSTVIEEFGTDSALEDALGKASADVTGLPSMVVSLFSSEVTASTWHNRKFYEGVFDAFPTVKAILASGFFYRGKEGVDKVEEVHGLVSYQTIAPVEGNEVRLLLPAASSMFGEGVVEVWRLLLRP